MLILFMLGKKKLSLAEAESKFWYTRYNGIQLLKVINNVLEFSKHIIGILPSIFYYLTINYEGILVI